MEWFVLNESVFNLEYGMICIKWQILYFSYINLKYLLKSSIIKLIVPKCTIKFIIIQIFNWKICCNSKCFDEL